ncbi:MAG: ATP-binding cassette domain-containing protein [Xanthomonadales bacterium]|nr:ATP-binding cassette domain-containing protein [Xanthomonadales bacterium]
MIPVDPIEAIPATDHADSATNTAAAAPEPAVQVAGLCKRHGQATAQPMTLNQLSFTVRSGECFGLLGPNGAGKTTTLRALLGLTPFDDGRIDVLGHPIPAQARQARKRTGVVPQMDNLDPEFSVEENLRVFGRYFGLKRPQIAERIPALLEFSALTGKRNARIDELSGGMQRRLTLARALINNPDLLVMDEPTTGLDPQARHLIWARLSALRDSGKTLLLTTHFMDEAERLCDRLLIIDHGRAVDEGSPRELIARHVEPEVVEIHSGVDRTWLDQTIAVGPPVRVETSGERLYCYTAEPAQLLAALHTGAAGAGPFLHRPANLEDVFLRLTGRDLREDA